MLEQQRRNLKVGRWKMRLKGKAYSQAGEWLGRITGKVVKVTLKNRGRPGSGKASRAGHVVLVWMRENS